MSDRERMLAEGPRVAPEPRTVEAYDPGSGRLAVRDAAGAPAASARRLSIGRLLVPALFAVFLVSQYLGAGAFAEVLFVGALIAAAAVNALTGRGEG